jgi:hypothetical protein
MVHLSKDRSFTSEIARLHGDESIVCSVSRIYGRPDAVTETKNLVTWYYADASIAFLFEDSELKGIVELEGGIPKSVLSENGANGKAGRNGSVPTQAESAAGGASVPAPGPPGVGGASGAGGSRAP